MLSRRKGTANWEDVVKGNSRQLLPCATIVSDVPRDRKAWLAPAGEKSFNIHKSMAFLSFYVSLSLYSLSPTLLRVRSFLLLLRTKSEKFKHHLAFWLCRMPLLVVAMLIFNLSLGTHTTRSPSLLFYSIKDDVRIEFFTDEIWIIRWFATPELPDNKYRSWLGNWKFTTGDNRACVYTRSNSCSRSNSSRRIARHLSRRLRSFLTAAIQ